MHTNNKIYGDYADFAELAAKGIDEIRYDFVNSELYHIYIKTSVENWFEVGSKIDYIEDSDDELGVLQLRQVEFVPDGLILQNLSKNFGSKSLSIKPLMADMLDVKLESGIRVSSVDSHELWVLPGSLPLTLFVEINGISIGSPELHLEYYQQA